MEYHRGPIGVAMDLDAGARPRLGLLVQRRLLSLYDRGFCTPEELDRRALDNLADLSEDDAVATLNEFESADRHSIKNLNGFLVSIVQKYRRAPPVGAGGVLSQGPMGGGLSLASLPPAPATMPLDLMYGFGDLEYVPEMPLQYVKQMQLLQQPPQHSLAPSQHHPRRPFSGDNPSVALIQVPPSERMLNEYGFSPPMQDILESLLAAKKINIAELDNRFVTELKNMPESTALAALHEFSQLDTSRVRNVPGYIIGISKKVGPTRRDDYDPFDVASKSEAAFAPGVMHSGPHSAASTSAYPVKRSRFDASAPVDVPHHPHMHPPQQQAAPFGASSAYGGSASSSALAGADLRDRIEREIERFIRSGQLIPEDIDDPTRDFLAQQPASIALRAISEFAAKDLRKVQNKIGFIRGMVKKMIEREREAAAESGGPQVPSHHPSQHSHHHASMGGKPMRHHERYR